MTSPDYDVDNWKISLAEYESSRNRSPWKEFTPEKRVTHREMLGK